MAGYEVSATVQVDRVTITTTATEAVALEPGRLSAAFVNRDADNSVYLGADLGVTTANGYELGSGESIVLTTKAAIWMISDASAVVHVFKEYL